LEGTDGYNFDDSFLAFFDKISKLAGGKTCFAHLERSVELDPTDIFARLFLGEAYREEGKLDAAIEQYEPIAAKSPEPRLHEKLANMYRQDSRYDQAIAEFQRTIELDPKSTSCHRELANLYRDMGQLEKAVVEYTQVLCLDPNDSYAKQELEKLQGR
jgi:tetratricopeptide (TPR) repeat protein